jgi:hypothetical protein
VNYNDLHEFTWNELSSLSWDELSLKADELIEKLRNDNRELPVSAIEKLQELCDRLPENAPEIKKGMTLSDACNLLNFILNYITKLPEIAEKYAPVAEKIIELIAKQFI